MSGDGSDVFISYKREERAEARKLAQALSCYGVRVWYDTSLEAGEDFEARLICEMNKTKAIIVLWCPLSATDESYVCSVEAPYAASSGKLLPVILKPCKIPRDYKELHTINLVSWNRRASQPGSEFSALLAKLGNTLGRDLVLDTHRAKRIDDLLGMHFNPGQREVFRDQCRYPVPAMVSVPDGHFEAGSPPSEPERELPPVSPGSETLRTIFFDTPFAVSRAPVTVTEFAAFVMESKSAELPRGASVCINDRLAIDPEASWRTPGFNQTDAHPVTCVSWYEAKAYAGWLSEVTGKRYRLLSESEWEYAARARSKKAFCSGDFIEPHEANFDSRVPYAGKSKTWDYRRGTTPAGKFERFEKNDWGLWDVHGNVAEWCEDSWHERRDNAPQDGRVVADKRRLGAPDDCRAVRGGSWRDAPRDLRCAARAAGHALERYNHIGFRLARDLPVIV